MAAPARSFPEHRFATDADDARSRRRARSAVSDARLLSLRCRLVFDRCIRRAGCHTLLRAPRNGVNAAWRSVMGRAASRRRYEITFGKLG